MFRVKAAEILRHIFFLKRMIGRFCASNATFRAINYLDFGKVRENGLGQGSSIKQKISLMTITSRQKMARRIGVGLAVQVHPSFVVATFNS